MGREAGERHLLTAAEKNFGLLFSGSDTNTTSRSFFTLLLLTRKLKRFSPMKFKFIPNFDHYSQHQWMEEG